MSWRTRLGNVFSHRRLDAEIDEELQFHLDQTVDDNIAAGMTPEDARRDAVRRFGGRAALRERTRDANLLLWLERFLQDLRHGYRMFARHPALSAICILSIAFGTGANVAIFSMADALLPRPLPVPQPAAVVTVGSKVLRGTFYRNVASYRDYLDIRDRAQTFEGLAAYTYETIAIAPHASDPPRVRLTAFVSENFFRVLGVDLQLGRAFLPDEDGRHGRDGVVIISDGLWRAGFASDPAVLGHAMRVAGREFSIVGVTSASFTGVDPYIHDNVFLPIGLLPELAELRRGDVLDARDARGMTLKGRLRPGVSLDEARAELASIGRDLERAYPDTNTNQALVAQTEFEYKYEVRPLDSAIVVILSVLSIAVLGVACANVTGLLASRAPVRAREMALRLAIGASRPRLVRQLLTECLAIAALGAIGGIAVGSVGISVLKQIKLVTDIVTMPAFDLDRRTLAFSLAIAALSAIVVGLGPALQTTRVDLTSSLKSSDRAGTGRTQWSARSLLVAVQVALSLVVVTLTVFAVKVLNREVSKGPGWRVRGAAMLNVDPGQSGYSREESARFFTTLIDKARTLSGVASVSATSAMPMFTFQNTPVLPEGQHLSRGEPPPAVWSASIHEQYFATMGIPMIAGRPFNEHDDDSAVRVAIVNDTLARHYWPGASAIGKRLQILEPDGALVEVVGVSRTTIVGFPGELPQNAVYFPYRQRPTRFMTLLTTTDGESATLVKPMEDLVRSLDPDVPIRDGFTMETFFGERVVGFGGVMLRLVGSMGLMGVTLTLIGLYGLVSYDVNRRTREIGIRIAVGATYARIVNMVLRQGMSPVALGVVLGVGFSVVAWRLMSQLVPFSYTVTPAIYVFVVALLVALTAFAAFLPARRAARVSPTEALRCE